MESHKLIAEFLQQKPLYAKIEIDNYYFHPDRFFDLPFQYYCPVENNIQTYKLILEPENLIKAKSNLAYDRFNDLFNPYQSEDSINFTHHFSGQCQFCKKNKINFLLNIYSEGSFQTLSIYDNPLIKGGRGGSAKQSSNDNESGKLFIRKIGQFPPYEITPEKDIFNFFKEEDKEFYKKALICLSQSFGVGAYAYLRRIIENEITSIVEALLEIENINQEKVKELYKVYKNNNQMSNLIEGIYNYLPTNLKSLGQNPLKVLYSHLSGGIHAYSEEDCLDKAFHLDTILKFTIKKLNEEKYELSNVRAALNNLKS